MTTPVRSLKQCVANPLLWIVAGALLLRLVLSFSISERSLLSIDGVDYRNIAENIAQGYGYSSSYYRWFEPVPPDSLEHHPDLARPPLLPVLGAATMRLPGSYMVYARLTPALLGALSVLLVYGVGAALFGRRSGLLASVVMAVYPYAVYYSARWSTENLALVFLWTAVWLWLRRTSRPSRSALLMGAALGFAGLARPNMLLVAGAVVVLSFARLGVRRAVLVVTGLLVILTPWAARNYSVTGVPNPATYFGPYNMWLGMNDPIYEMYRHPASPDFTVETDRLYSVYSAGLVKELEERGIYEIRDVNRFWLARYADYWRAHPGRALRIQVSRLAHYFRPIPMPGSSNAKEIVVSALSVFPLMGLSLLALLKDRRSRRGIFGAIVLGSILASLPFTFSLRFRYPVLDPLLVILGGHGAYLLAQRWSWSRRDMRVHIGRRLQDAS